MLKRLLASFALVLLPMSFLVTSPTLAQVNLFEEVCPVDDTGKLIDPANAPTVCLSVDEVKDTNPIYGEDGILTRAINILSLVTGAIATIVLVIAGIRMMLSQGDPGKVSSSRSQIIYALVGVAVALVAQAVVIFVLNQF